MYMEQCYDMIVEISIYFAYNIVNGDHMNRKLKITRSVTEYNCYN